MRLKFYGIERAEKEGWILIQDPPPVRCRLDQREAYVERLEHLRKMGAIIVGKREHAGSRVWIFGLPSGEPDREWLKQQAEAAGMLLPASHPQFTFRWRGTTSASAMQLVALHGDILCYHLEQVCKYKENVMRRRNIIVKEVELWRKYRDRAFRVTGSG